MEHLTESLRHFRYTHVFCQKCKSAVSIASGELDEVENHIVQCLGTDKRTYIYERSILEHAAKFKISFNKFRLTHTMILFGGRPFNDDECLGCGSYEVHQNGGCAEGAINKISAYKRSNEPLIVSMIEHFRILVNHLSTWNFSSRVDRYSTTLEAVRNGMCNLDDDDEFVRRRVNDDDVEASFAAYTWLKRMLLEEHMKNVDEQTACFEKWIKSTIQEDYNEIRNKEEEVRNTDYGRRMTAHCTKPLCDEEAMKYNRLSAVGEMQKLMRECIEAKNIHPDEATNSITQYLDVEGADSKSVLDVLMKTPFGKVRFIHNGMFDDPRIEALLEKVQSFPTLADRYMHVSRMEDALLPRFDDFENYFSGLSNSTSSLLNHIKFRRGRHTEARYEIKNAVVRSNLFDLKKAISKFEAVFQSEREYNAHLFANLFNVYSLKSSTEQMTEDYETIREAVQQELRDTLDFNLKLVEKVSSEMKRFWSQMEKNETLEFKEVGWLFKLFFTHNLEAHKEYYSQVHGLISRNKTDEEEELPDIKEDLDIFGSFFHGSTIHVYQMMNFRLNRSL